jgi:hypothetical protein
VGGEGEVAKEGGADEVALGDVAPDAGVGGVVGVVAEGEVLIFAEGDFVELAAGEDAGVGVALVAILLRHDFLEAGFFGEFAVVVEVG